MPYPEISTPKISAILNNCPLHAITPELTQEIALIAAGKPSKNNEFKPGYEELKRCFIKYYDLDDKFTWQQFAATLQCYNAFDTQIIMGPVLRMFMETNLRSPDIDFPFNQGEINQDTQLDPEKGRYYSLSPDKLYAFVSKPLGFGIHYHQKDSTNTPDSEKNQIALIHIYHDGSINGAENGGHWERLPKNAKEQPVDFESHADTQLNTINEVIKSLASYKAGIHLMKRHVFHTASGLNDITLEYLSRLDQCALEIKTYLERVQYLPNTLAIKSLGDIDTYTTSFIKDYSSRKEFKEIALEDSYESYYKDALAGKPVRADALAEVNNLIIKVKDLPYKKPVRRLFPSVESSHVNVTTTVVPDKPINDASVVSTVASPRVNAGNAASPNPSTNDVPVTAAAATPHVSTSATVTPDNTSETDLPVYGPEEDKEPIALPLEVLATKEKEDKTPTPPVVKNKTSREETDAEKRFNHQLELLSKKIAEFQTRRDKSGNKNVKRLDRAIKEAGQLHQKLTEQGEVYFNAPTEGNYKEFQSNCNDYITAAHVELDQHRGWKQILGNIALAIAGAVVVYLIAAGIHQAKTGKFLFFATDSSKKLDDIADSVNKANPSA